VLLMQGRSHMPTYKMVVIRDSVNNMKARSCMDMLSLSYYKKREAFEEENFWELLQCEVRSSPLLMAVWWR